MPDKSWEILGKTELELVPCAVPNNDLRYEINKIRSQLYARKHDKQIMWCCAKDFASSEALRIDPSLPANKISWL